MAFRMLRQPSQTYVEQGQTEDEQPRFFDCFSCIFLRMNMMKMSQNEPRYRCQILDFENTEIEKQNEEIFNPTLKKPLKKCVIHPESEE